MNEEIEEILEQFANIFTDSLRMLQEEIEENKDLKNQLNDIHSNFCKFNWQESNGKQIYNQLKELFESIYRKENK